jgi:quercetin dioxygenase-like cupin family protein
MTVPSHSGNPTQRADAQARPVILRPAELPSTDRGGGNKTIPLVSGKVGSQQMLNGITIIAPGAAIALHSHNCEESVIVIEGRGVVELDGVDHEVGTFDTTWVPANVPHRFKNTSQEHPLRIFWTYASVDATRTLAATGETRSIGSEHTKPR